MEGNYHSLWSKYNSEREGVRVDPGSGMKKRKVHTEEKITRGSIKEERACATLQREQKSEVL